MSRSPLPSSTPIEQVDEPARVAALHEYGVLDEPADDELEAVVRTAAVVAGVPTATLNLIDENRQCQLTTVGFTGADSPRDDSMCAAVMGDRRTTQVPDARTDARFVANPWVDGRLAHVRFYTSVPLITPGGHVLGSLCVFDTEPRTLTPGQTAALEDLAAVVLALFERRRQARRNAELAAEAHQERARAERNALELEAGKELTDAVHTSIEVAIVACDGDGRLTLFNRAAREWHGLGPDASLDPSQWAQRYQLYAADGATLLTPQQVPLFRALHDGKVEDVEMVIAPADRRAVRVLCTGRALTRADGTSLGAVVTMTDVTRDRAQRQELAEREQLLAAVLETAPDAFITTDATGAVTAWNPAAQAMFAWTAEQATGRRLDELIIPEHLAAAHHHGLAHRAATGEAKLSGAVQVPARRRDGSGLLVELSLGAFPWRGERRFHAFLRDVTEREAARERLAKANSDLAAANQELDRFTATVAHDLKTPLTAIAGYTEILHDVVGERSQTEATALASITRAASRMRLMIDDLLDHARACHEPINQQTVDLNSLVDELAGELQACNGDRVHVTREPLPAVHAQPTLLRQVVANLMGNAAKYVAAGVDPHIHITATPDDQQLTIRISDNGIGIAESSREKVFAMFHREPTQQPYHGTGIGLSTCRRIVERHGGRIWIEPGDAAGTTVAFSLPHHQPTTAGA